MAIHETGQTEEGHPFIAMEFVSGHDLAQQLAKRPLPTARALCIARAVCDSLTFAHQHGVVHRDRKPANVIIADDGTVKVADFGVARIRTEVGDTPLTFTGLVLGTLALTLDLYDTSGLELIGGADYMKNITTVNGSLPYERFLRLTLKVRPDGGRVGITATLD